MVKLSKQARELLAGAFNAYERLGPHSSTNNKIDKLPKEAQKCLTSMFKVLDKHNAAIAKYTVAIKAAYCQSCIRIEEYYSGGRQGLIAERFG
jgi:hypothetical protein